jgi:curved DNA-binding protein CbpA
MSDLQSDYYKILNISRNASEQEIKTSYRELALKYHPDKNDSSHMATEFIKLINKAKEVLSDPVKRAEYDDRMGRKDFLYDIICLIKKLIQQNNLRKRRRVYRRCGEYGLGQDRRSQCDISNPL